MGGGAGEMKKEGSGVDRAQNPDRIGSNPASLITTSADISILSQKPHLNSQHQQVAFQYVAKPSLGLT